MKSLQLVIFDMDGVLVDSEPLHTEAKFAVLRRFGVNQRPDLSWSVGRPNQELWQRLIQEYRLPATATQCEEFQYLQILEWMRQRKMRPCPGIMPLLDWLEQRRISVAVASSSDRSFVTEVLRLLGLEERIGYVACGDDVPRKKPAPDVYRKVLEQFGVQPDEAAAIEDSCSGSTAAFEAGIPCIGYRNPSSGDQDLTKTMIVVDHLEQVIPVLEEEFI